MEKLIRERIIQALEQKVFPACVVGVGRKDGSRFVIPAGKFTFEPTSQDIKADSLFDVASITKTVPTACLMLKLIEEGRVDLDEPLIKFIPEFKNKERNKVKIRHLLTQTLDFKPNNGHFRLSFYKDRSPEEILEVIFTTEFVASPGEKFSYSNATSILLGLVVDRVYGQSLASLAENLFFVPLAMTRTTFYPERFPKDIIVPTEFDDWRGRLIQGEVHDESAYVLKSKMAVGSAGLFSTAPDLLTFLTMLLNRGLYRGQQFFSSATIELMQTNQLSMIGESHALGWELDQPQYMGRNVPENTFGKTGFTGCLILTNLSCEVGVVVLTNYIFPKRKLDRHQINEFRKDIIKIIFDNL